MSGECDLKSTISFDYLTSSDKVLIIRVIMKVVTL